MKRSIAALAIAGAVVIAAIAPAFAAQFDTCQLITRHNLAECVFKRAAEQSGD